MAQMFNYMMQEKPGGKKTPAKATTPAAASGSPQMSPEMRRMAAEAEKTQAARDSAFKAQNNQYTNEEDDETPAEFRTAKEGSVDLRTEEEKRRTQETLEQRRIDAGKARDAEGGKPQQILPPDKTRIPAAKSVSNQSWMRRYESQIAKNGYAFVRHSDGNWYRHDAKGKKAVRESEVPDADGLLHTSSAKEASSLDIW